jgi:uncharacterized protein YrrD
MPKKNLIPCSTMTNNKKQPTSNCQKQTQSNPILSACMAGKIALSAAEGPVAINLNDVFYNHKAIKISVIAAERRF